VLDALPELAARLSADERERACLKVRARVLSWPDEEPGTIPDEVLEPGAFGLLLLDGWLSLRIESAGATRMEIVGPGDLLRLWLPNEDVVAAPSRLGWRILSPARLAILDRSFATTISPWPEISEALLERLVMRARKLVLQMTAEAQRRAEDRILLVLWQLADRWGSVTPQGVTVRVPLTHQMLADLTGTRRPPVTTAIGQLRRDAVLATTDEGLFVLLGPSPADGDSPGE
jgi:hypothetical protein